MNLLDDNFDAVKAAAGKYVFAPGVHIRLKPLPPEYESYYDWMEAMPGDLYCGWDGDMDDMGEYGAIILKAGHSKSVWIVEDRNGACWTLPERMMEVV